ncbi:MAG: rhamnogalacturonan acetylesterase [Lachnospiraceae bacterium]|nr:rhamnogalacturonan acetylesterase [Lachnospiraceae bacterium]
MFQKLFCFCGEADKTKRGCIRVTTENLYSETKGYGFVTDENRSKIAKLQIPGISNGFIPMDVSSDRPVPTFFKCDVPRQGNYHVEIEAENDGSPAIIFMERRRLYLNEAFSGRRRFSFSVNVCDIIPEGKQQVFTDKDLDISWIGSGLKVREIEVKECNCPTIFIAGDSTVTDQPANYPYSPGTSYSGWGQMLSAYLNDTVVVSNHAHSGLTTESFRKEGHYSIIESYIKPGDYFFMQFGHNDQKLEHLRENSGYRENIVRYIQEIRAKGAFPVIVTSLSRNTWFKEGESYNDLLKAYSLECEKIGAEMDVPVLDLHGYSMELIIKNGLNESKKYYYPGDYSHTNDYGAYIMAGFVASEMKRAAQVSKLAAYKAFAGMMREEVSDWEIDPELLKLPDAGDQAMVESKSYQLEMDRLNEIITNK